MPNFIWPEQTPVQFKCIDKWQQTKNTFSFQFSLTDTTLAQEKPSFDFKPGQFVSLGIKIKDQIHYRPYSISNQPNQNYIELTIKAVEGGLVSHACIDNLHIGDTIFLLAPQGEFHLDQPHRKKILLISAGCGITPVMSMARYITKQLNSQYDICFVHAARQLEDIIFKDELLRLSKISNFELAIALDNLVKPQQTDSSHIEFFTAQGPLTQERLLHLCPDLMQRSIFLCGPLGFMDLIQSYLDLMKFDMSHFYQESFTPALNVTKEENLSSQSKEATENLAKQTYTINLNKLDLQTSAEENTLLLDALESAKAPIIAACRSGICGSCKCKVQGKIKRLSSATLTEEEIAQGYALACSSQIEGDLEVELN